MKRLITKYTAKAIKKLKKNVIAEIKIQDEIKSHDKTIKALEKIENSNKVKGLLLTINCPGGDPCSSEVIYTKIKKIATKMPVISFVEGMATSGGYMIAIAAPKIISIKTGMIGSIGVWSGQFDSTELMKKIGINFLEFATSPYKGTGNPFTKPTETQIEYRTDLINQVFEIFKELVKEERQLAEDELKQISNAKVFIGANAIPLKLIDEIGDKDFAINEIKAQLEEDVNVEKIKLKEFVIKKPKNFFLTKNHLSSFLLQINKFLTIK